METSVVSRRAPARTKTSAGVIPALTALSAALSLPVSAQLQITFVDLNPAGSIESRARAVDGAWQVGTASVGGGTHAARWSGSAGSFVDLHPAGASSSEAFGLGDARQSGYVMIDNTTSHAALWSGTPSSFVDLNPRARRYSVACAADGPRQAGWTSAGSWPDIYYRAALWSGSADSWVELHPPGAASSAVYGVCGSRQAGYASTNGYHAALWSGTAESFVDLHPAGASASEALGLSRTQQSGYAAFEGRHAALWSGTAASFVDLHPAGASDSIASATSGSHQVGRAMLNGVWHAALWSGTAASFVDLGQALGDRYGTSEALSIWTGGATSFVAGYAQQVSSAQMHAILWTVIESPTPPRLELAHAESAGGMLVVTLTWTNHNTPCVLESTAKLTGGWNTVSAPLTTNANWILSTVTNAASAQFFRLRGT